MLIKTILVAAVAAVSLIIPATAHASGDPTGICSGGGCWRTTGPTDYWPRDIAGDTHQQFDVTYWGQAPGADNGACSQFSGIGVYTFVSPADGFKFIGAGFFSGGQYYVGDQISNNRFSNFVWQNNGVLVNCGDSVGKNFLLNDNSNFYSQLFTAATPEAVTWSQVHV